MLYLTLRNPADATTTEVSGTTAAAVLPQVKEALERFGIRKAHGEFQKHDLELLVAGDGCEKHLSTFQKRLKEVVVGVRRVPHRTFNGRVVLLT